MAAATAFITSALIGGIVSVHRRRVQTGDEALVGVQTQALVGVSPQPDRSVGTVFVDGEWSKAISDAPAAARQECMVQGRQGLTLAVKRFAAVVFGP